MKRKLSSNGVKLYIVIWIGIILLNLLFWNSRAFSDVYVQRVFPIWVETYGRITGLFPFSVGEWMILLGILVLICLLLCLLVLLFYRGKSFVRFVTGYGCFLAWVVAVVALIMTLNCFSLYHTSALSNPQELAGEEEIHEENLLGMWNYLATRANALSLQVKRAEDGRVFAPEKDAMEKTAILALRGISDRYPRLMGYYPKPKRLFFSDSMCQQNMAGYYFPFSMEANINDAMYVTNKPATMCHELAHLKGYISEDEASFLGFLACVNSEDTLFQYSGYLSVLGYFAKEINELGASDPSIADRYEIIQVTKQVREDRIFLLPEDKERIEQEAILSSEKVDKISDTFVDTSLKLNGVKQGSQVYAEVVKLLVRYYAKNLVGKS